MLYILAGSFKQAEIFANRHRLRKTDYLYLNSPNDVRGLRSFSYIKVGTYYERANISDLMDAVFSCNAKEIKEGEVKSYERI